MGGGLGGGGGAAFDGGVAFGGGRKMSVDGAGGRDEDTTFGAAGSFYTGKYLCSKPVFQKKK